MRSKKQRERKESEEKMDEGREEKKRTEESMSDIGTIWCLQAATLPAEGFITHTYKYTVHLILFVCV